MTPEDRPCGIFLESCLSFVFWIRQRLSSMWSFFFLLLLSITVICTTTVHAADSPPSTLPTPPFVTHVTSHQREMALQAAQNHHQEAIRRALDNYPVDQEPLGDPVSKLDFEQVKDISAGGALPDFDDMLPHRVHVTQLLTPQECQQVIRMAEDHFQGKWPTQTSGQYQVAGFYIQNVPTVHAWFLRICRKRLFPQLQATFPDFVQNAADLCVDGAYLFKYTPETGGRTDIHTDSGCLTFTISLNDDYQGGGTFFQGLQDAGKECVLSMKQGQVTLRPGGVKHCGYPVEAGNRYIIGGFCMHREKPEVVRQLMLQSDNVPLLEAAVAMNPKCDVPYNILAGAYLKQGDAAKAQQVLQYCLEHIHSFSGEVAYALGSLCMDKDDLEQARKCFDICLQVDQYDVEAMLSMAEVCNKLNDRNAEEAYFRRVVDTPGANAKAKASAYCDLGVLHQGQDAEIEYYQRSIECVKDSFVPHYSLAAAYASRGDYFNAINTFRRAIPLASSPQYEMQALQALYKACAFFVQNQKPPPSNQQEMMKHFIELMGEDNYRKLAASAQKH